MAVTGRFLRGFAGQPAGEVTGIERIAGGRGVHRPCHGFAGNAGRAAGPGQLAGLGTAFDDDLFDAECPQPIDCPCRGGVAEQAGLVLEGR